MARRASRTTLIENRELTGWRRSQPVPAGIDLPLGERGWHWTAAAVVLFAAAIRLYHLSLAPLHHDEGVNGIFLTTLFRTGNYQYDPANYHGPSLYYLALVVAYINRVIFSYDGLSTLAIRLVPAIFGTATVYLILLLRRYLGPWGTLCAAMLMACSPGAVYLSRYFIHEVPFVFFTLSIVVTMLRYRETKRAVWMLLASASAALLFATKETAVITVAVLAAAYIAADVYICLRTPGWRAGPDGSGQRQPGVVNKLLSLRHSGREDRRKLIFLVLKCLALFAAIHVLLYSSFGKNPKGVYDSLAAYGYWLKTGVGNSVHDHFAYLRWMSQEELPLLLLGGAGLLAMLYRPRNRFGLFCGLWAAGILVAYSLIPYKTPWLTLNIIMPLALVAGCGIEEGCRLIKNRRWQMVVLLAGVVAVVASAYRAIDLAWFRYDDNSLPYVYAHTRRQFLGLVGELERIAAINGTGIKTTIAVVSPEYWPLPWYLRDYSNAGYWGRVVPVTQAIIIGEAVQQPELERSLGSNYRFHGSYELRPGVMLIVFVRRDVVS